MSRVLISLWLQPMSWPQGIMMMSIISLHDDTALLCSEMPLVFGVSLLINNHFWKHSPAFTLVLYQL